MIDTVKIPKAVFLPVYHHLLNSTANINFLWGGRDSGKTHFVAQKLIMDCLTLPYFRCLLIKKTYNSIKESQWQTIKDVVDEWGLTDVFTFKVSPFTIECENGNRFIARGCDDPQSIKGVKDPSHAWYEEGNQLTMDDFITVTTTLRTNKAKIQQWFSFNPECEGDYEEFWLYKMFFKDKSPNGNHDWTLTLPNGKEIIYTYSSTHTTYQDNKYVRGERIIFLEQLQTIQPYYYQVYTRGIWGRRQNNSPFVYAFDRQKHLGKTTLNRHYEAVISFDFNRNPLCCSIWQHYNHHIYCIDAIKLDNSDIYKLCDHLKRKYPNVLWIVTGDATGKASNAMVQNGLHYYTIIKSQLNLSMAQLKVPTVNPRIEESQVVINAVLYNIPTTIDPDNCKGLIYDLENVRMLADGSIEKRNRNDPAQQSDFLDTARYYTHQFHRSVLKQ